MYTIGIKPRAMGFATEFTKQHNIICASSGGIFFSMKIQISSEVFEALKRELSQCKYRYDLVESNWENENFSLNIQAGWPKNPLYLAKQDC